MAIISTARKSWNVSIQVTFRETLLIRTSFRHDNRHANRLLCVFQFSHRWILIGDSFFLDYLCDFRCIYKHLKALNLNYCRASGCFMVRKVQHGTFKASRGDWERSSTTDIECFFPLVWLCRLLALVQLQLGKGAERGWRPFSPGGAGRLANRQTDCCWKSLPLCRLSHSEITSDLTASQMTCVKPWFPIKWWCGTVPAAWWMRLNPSLSLLEAETHFWVLTRQFTGGEKNLVCCGFSLDTHMTRVEAIVLIPWAGRYR